MPDYSNIAYWDERYASDENASFDWYLSFETLLPYILPYLSKDGMFEIFVPGCGNSTLSAKLYEAGYTNLSNIDASKIVIAQMQQRYSEYKDMDFSAIDATNMKQDLPDACFDLVIEKALADAVLCGDDGFTRATSMMSEMHRVLKPGGIYLSEIPKAPVASFMDSSSPSCYYLYICKKRA